MSEVKIVEQSHSYPPDHDFVAHVKRLEETISEYVQMYREWYSKNSELEAENARLREALEETTAALQYCHKRMAQAYSALSSVEENKQNHEKSK